MIFVANVLTMNGGTTFILRVCKELRRHNRRPAVLLLTDRSDPNLVEQISACADIIPLWSYTRDGGAAGGTPLAVFMPLSLQALVAELARYGSHLHVMGGLGLIPALRIVGLAPHFRLTVGVYHQNEFLYRSPPFLFPREVKRIFTAIPAENILFFNEWSRENYSKVFNNNYTSSTIAPIGIELEDNISVVRSGIKNKIVSIGNLEGFKTYNRHVISMIPDLRLRFPGISYDIYGIGPMESELRSLAQTLGVSDRVKFCGQMEYGDLQQIVASCDLFVGSGTALLEAAAAGRPALIGIESVEEPVTYGYLSDGVGFSYHEYVPDLPKVSIKALITNLFSDTDCWTKIASACSEKAREFSVEATVMGLDLAARKAKPVSIPLTWGKLVRMAISAVALAAGERLGWLESFSQRRNQSYRP